MPFFDRICTACDWKAIDVFEPTFPLTSWCPQCGHGAVRAWISRTSHVNGDECDIVQENGFPHPTRFTSKAELRRALAAKGLEQHAKNAGPDDKICGRWDTMDAQTLANARILVSRSRPSSAEAPPPDIPLTWTVRELPE